MVYGAELEEWTKILPYSAMETTQAQVHKERALVKSLKKLEENGEEILKFMASNGLVANPTETTLLITNIKEEG